MEFVKVVMNAGDLARAEDYVANAFLDHHPWPGHPGTLDGFKAGLVEFRETFPDVRFEVVRVDAEGEIVSALVARIGTHIESGRVLRIEVLEMMRVCRGRIVERWGFLDEDAVERLRPFGLANAVAADRRLFGT
jgi:predicted ester cyclase